MLWKGKTSSAKHRTGTGQRQEKIPEKEEANYIDFSCIVFCLFSPNKTKNKRRLGWDCCFTTANYYKYQIRDKQRRYQSLIGDKWTIAGNNLQFGEAHAGYWAASFFIAAQLAPLTSVLLVHYAGKRAGAKKTTTDMARKQCGIISSHQSPNSLCQKEKWKMLLMLAMTGKWVIYACSQRRKAPLLETICWLIDFNCSLFCPTCVQISLIAQQNWKRLFLEESHKMDSEQPYHMDKII